MIVLEYVARFTGWHVLLMTMWPQTWPRSGDLRMTKVFHSRQDCGPPPIGHGLSGQDSSGYRERDGGHTGHSRCEC